MRNILHNVYQPIPILVTKVWWWNLDYVKFLQAKYFTGENIPIYGNAKIVELTCIIFLPPSTRLVIILTQTSTGLIQTSPCIQRYVWQKVCSFLGDYLAFLLCECNIVEFILHQKNHENTRVVQVLPVSAAVLTLRLHTGRFVVFFCLSWRPIWVYFSTSLDWGYGFKTFTAFTMVKEVRIKNK